VRSAESINVRQGVREILIRWYALEGRCRFSIQELLRSLTQRGNGLPNPIHLRQRGRDQITIRSQNSAPLLLTRVSSIAADTRPREPCRLLAGVRRRSLVLNKKFARNQMISA
jgi:hypothetical protein